MEETGKPTSAVEACQARYHNLSLEGLHCGPLWDDVLCWPPRAAGDTVLLPCPPLKGAYLHKSAARRCSELGQWEGRLSGNPLTVIHDHYLECFLPEIQRLIRELLSDSEEDARLKMRVAQGTRILEMVGLVVSLMSLLISLFIFCSFRGLRNNRTRIHWNLFLAMLIQVLVRLTVYTDQYLTRTSVSASRGSGIDNTPYLCESFYILLEYARTAMFLWMFIEGLYLHNLITVTVFHDNPNYKLYHLLGWGVPALMTTAWAVTTGVIYTGTECWWGYNLSPYFWILEGPRLTVIIANLIFLLNIIRVLVTKLKRSNSSEAKQVRKAVRAAIVLLPLLGITNFLGMVSTPLRGKVLQFAVWSYGTNFLSSFQGFFIAFLYCFLNREALRQSATDSDGRLMFNKRLSGPYTTYELFYAKVCKRDTLNVASIDSFAHVPPCNFTARVLLVQLLCRKVVPRHEELPKFLLFLLRPPYNTITMSVHSRVHYSQHAAENTVRPSVPYRGCEAYPSKYDTIQEGYH